MEPDLQPFGKLLIIIGLIIVAVGAIMLFTDKIPFIGRLPGDIYIKKENYTVYIPIASSILLSIILSLIAYLLRK